MYAFREDLVGNSPEKWGIQMQISVQSCRFPQLHFCKTSSKSNTQHQLPSKPFIAFTHHQKTDCSLFTTLYNVWKLNSQETPVQFILK